MHSLTHFGTPQIIVLVVLVGFLIFELVSRIVRGKGLDDLLEDKVIDSDTCHDELEEAFDTSIPKINMPHGLNSNTMAARRKKQAKAKKGRL